MDGAKSSPAFVIGQITTTARRRREIAFTSARRVVVVELRIWNCGISIASTV